MISVSEFSEAKKLGSLPTEYQVEYFKDLRKLKDLFKLYTEFSCAQEFVAMLFKIGVELHDYPLDEEKNCFDKAKYELLSSALRQELYPDIPHLATITIHTEYEDARKVGQTYLRTQ